MQSMKSASEEAFDNRAGCACIVDTMKQLEKEQASLAVNVVGAFRSAGGGRNPRCCGNKSD